MKKNKVFRYVIAVLLIVFALLTLFLSSSVIFDWFGIRAKEGNYVPLVVWANFMVSLLYLLASYGYLFLKKWSLSVMLIAAIILVLAYIGLFIYINNDGLYESRTIGAMLFRILVTLFFAGMIYYGLKKKT
ncbi:MAG: hypothetical protein CL528_10915 [Aequorivita sp.]|jgi:magnesium-transporting ATPase (P-type)|nr:hypothetical protein [Aequorivita sp.]MBP42276.1 hypothetical protein [Aequorivita sp.]|tara:strand:+ start:250350 stop:250742 length:393 start_codon:yes stop_codon:yes gene_type:complete